MTLCEPLSFPQSDVVHQSISLDDPTVVIKDFSLKGIGAVLERNGPSVIFSNPK